MGWTELSRLSDILSVIGFLITIYLAIKVRQMRRRYKFIETIPANLKGLKNCSKEIRKYLSGTFKDEELGIRKQLVIASVHLKSLSGKIESRTEKLNILADRFDIWWALNFTLTADKAVRFNERIDGLIVDIENKITDENLEIRNG